MITTLKPAKAGLVCIAPDFSLRASSLAGCNTDALGITSLCVCQSCFLGIISLAVRNRSYTTETRLRGLKKHEGISRSCMFIAFGQLGIDCL